LINSSFFKINNTPHKRLVTPGSNRGVYSLETSSPHSFENNFTPHKLGTFVRSNFLRVLKISSPKKNK